MARRSIRAPHLASALRLTVVLALTPALLALASLAGREVGAAPSDPGSAYTPLSPFRLLDTRLSGAPLAGGAVLSLQVAGVDSVPDAATAVVLNVTATDATAGSYLTVYPAGGPVPVASNLNVAAGETVANLTVVPVGAGGLVSIYNAQGSVDVVADLEGYFALPAAGSTAGSYVALPPARICDTRSGSGEPCSGRALEGGGTLGVQVAGVGGVPATGATSVALNLTVTDPSSSSYLTVYPAGMATPTASNLNWWPGDTLANRVIVPLGRGGEVSFFNAAGSAQLVVDVTGYFTGAGLGAPNASLYHPLGPVRVLDTRAQGGTLQASAFLGEQLAGVDGISASADAVVANLTTADASQDSFFSIVPQQVAPSTSDLNFAVGQVVPNLVIATLDGEGGASVYNAQGTADAVLDVFGYFEPEYGVLSSPAAPCGPPSIGGAGATITQGQPVAVSVSATCPAGTEPEYQYWYKPWYSSVWLLAQGWTASDTYSYDTSAWTLGTYDLAVWVSTAPVFQGQAAGSYAILAPTYQWAANTIPSQSDLLGMMVDPANAGVVAGCYAQWSAGQACGFDGSPGQCTFWAELNWSSPYCGQVAGDAARLPHSYTVLTGQPPATTPVVGALAVWGGPGPLAGSSDGHVGVVTGVAPDGSSYTVSQMNWSDQGWDISTMWVPFSAGANATLDLLGFLPPG